MFEIFASICMFTTLGVTQCDDFSLATYDDPLTCEIVAADVRRDPRYVDPVCIEYPGEENE